MSSRKQSNSKENTIRNSKKLAEDAAAGTKKLAKASVTGARKAGKAVTVGAKKSAQKIGEATEKTKNVIKKAVDQNGDGTVDIYDVIIMGLKTPGVKINRDDFLSREFKKFCDQREIEKAITETPAKAGIDPELIDRLVDDSIKTETMKASGMSAALGTMGGVKALAAVPIDLGQYYGALLRTAQKMMYLYGWPQIDVEEQSEFFDDGTMNTLVLCLGVMFGVQSANKAIKVLANGLAKGVEKKLLQTALTKGTIYPVIKETAKWFGVKMTKSLLASSVKQVIPIAGAAIGGGITYVSFGPCCKRLKKQLADTVLSNPNHIVTEQEEREVEEIIDAEIITD